MKYALVILCLITCFSYGMTPKDEELQSLDTDSDSSSHDKRMQSLEEHKEPVKMRTVIADMTNFDWKNISDTLDLSKKKLDSIEGLSDYCKPSPAADVPPIFPYATLTKILLQKNKLQSIKGADFAGFKNLRYLDISKNQITSLDIGDLFNACPRLKYLDASHNKLNEITWSDHPVWPRLCRYNEKYYNNDNLPTINLIGNTINKSNQQWTQECYNKQEARFYLSSEAYDNAAMGSTYGILSGALTAAFTILVGGSLLSFIAVPVGCGLGGVIGFLDPSCHNKPKIPLYFKLEDLPEEEMKRNMYAPVSCWQFSCCL